MSYRGWRELAKSGLEVLTGMCIMVYDGITALFCYRAESSVKEAVRILISLLFHFERAALVSLYILTAIKYICDVDACN